MCSAIGAASALAVATGPIAFTVRSPEAGAAFGDVAVSEGVVDIISSAAHGDNDDDNDDDDDDDDEYDEDEDDDDDDDVFGVFGGAQQGGKFVCPHPAGNR